MKRTVPISFTVVFAALTVWTAFLLVGIVQDHLARKEQRLQKLLALERALDEEVARLDERHDRMMRELWATLARMETREAAEAADEIRTRGYEFKSPTSGLIAAD